MRSEPETFTHRHRTRLVGLEVSVGPAQDLDGDNGEARRARLREERRRADAIFSTSAAFGAAGSVGAG